MEIAKAQKAFVNSMNYQTKNNEEVFKLHMNTPRPLLRPKGRW